MQVIINKMNPINKMTDNEEKNNLPGYPVYPVSEDIYSNCLEEKDIDPEDISKTKEPIEKHSARTSNGKDFDDDAPGSDLDVPGSELDDTMEIIGSEDEENNYYSLGGDDHDDLDEDKDE